MTLPGETEAGSAGRQPCRGIAWWAHRDDDWSAEVLLPRSPKNHIGSVDPYALKIPARRAEFTLTENARIPFHAEPGQNLSPSVRLRPRFHAEPEQPYLRHLRALNTMRGHNERRKSNKRVKPLHPGRRGSLRDVRRRNSLHVKTALSVCKLQVRRSMDALVEMLGVHPDTDGTIRRGTLRLLLHRLSTARDAFALGHQWVDDR